MTIELIAPCGMNCAACIAHLRPKNQCAGCLSTDGEVQGHCRKCRIKLCAEHENAEFVYCFDCRRFPCARMKGLDKRYRENYHVSLIENLLQIREDGIGAFVERERERWACKGCGAALCVHREACLVCGRPLLTPSPEQPGPYS